MEASQIITECTNNGILDMDKVKAKAKGNKELIEETVRLAEQQGISPQSNGRKRQMIMG